MNQAMHEKIKIFLLGVIASLLVFVLLGVAGGNLNDSAYYGPPNYGRYQVSSWATQLGPNSGILGAFVVDTVSGETKTVYSRIYGQEDNGVTLKSELYKPFSAIK